MDMAGPLIGVLGGMGPLATADFMSQLVKSNPVSRDQDHPRLAIYSNPCIPDRSAALIGRGPSPLPALIDGIATLNAWGADVIAIPCNTAHQWLGDLVQVSDAPILGIVEAVARDLELLGLTRGCVGVLGTAGLLRAGIYQRDLAGRGYHALLPTDRELWDWVEPAIRAVKAGWIDQAEVSLAAAITALTRRGAEAVVLACTELPLAAPAAVLTRPTPIVSSTLCLARACLNWVALEQRRRGTAAA